MKRHRPSSEMCICLSGLRVKLHIHIYAIILPWLFLLSQCLCMTHTAVARRTGRSCVLACCCLTDTALKRTAALTQLLKHEHFVASNLHSTLVFFYFFILKWTLWRTESHKMKLSNEADLALTLDKIHVASFLFLRFNTCV